RPISAKHAQASRFLQQSRLELATYTPLSASASPARFRIGSRHPKSAHHGTHLRKPRRKNAQPTHGV
ncbi:MAG TPA: hypothetical protein PLZ16_12345, partial [Gammaproteobacteria bacterium]|nr:hypothetical protein [Gammaproteobacteria bacterium]